MKALAGGFDRFIFLHPFLRALMQAISRPMGGAARMICLCLPNVEDIYTWGTSNALEPQFTRYVLPERRKTLTHFGQ
jgi:hypothetical protein